MRPKGFPYRSMPFYSWRWRCNGTAMAYAWDKKLDKEDLIRCVWKFSWAVTTVGTKPPRERGGSADGTGGYKKDEDKLDSVA